jgi:hypothetical protein
MLMTREPYSRPHKLTVNFDPANAPVGPTRRHAVAGPGSYRLSWGSYNKFLAKLASDFPDHAPASATVGQASEPSAIRPKRTAFHRYYTSSTST